MQHTYLFFFFMLVVVLFVFGVFCLQWAGAVGEPFFAVGFMSVQRRERNLLNQQ